MTMSKFSKSSAALTPSVCNYSPPPHISFISKVKKMDKVDGPDADKSEWIKLKFLMDPDTRLQALPTVCYLQGWMKYPRGLDQVGDGLP
jgi:hypothetical protein